jgi:trehalose 6-phosphate synthase/phosphatase
MSEQHARRLITVSNRLPIVLRRAPEQPLGWQAQRATGGLVSALSPVLQARGGEWIGWPGVTDMEDHELEPLLSELAQETGYNLTPVALTAEQHDYFYLGFANEVIWPLFHDLQTRANFDPRYYATYEEVNRHFAAVIARRAKLGDVIWIHDYHLMNTAQEVRKLGVTANLLFFLHIPFPPPDIFLKLPWRSAILNGLLQHDLLGFQTSRDRDNFLACTQLINGDLPLVKQEELITIVFENRQIQLGVFPIGIDNQSFEQVAATRGVTQLTRRIRATLDQQQIMLGVDRLDYTKGIEERLEAFRYVLTHYPHIRQRMTFVQVAVPSRTDIPEYRELKQRIERLVGEINGQFTELGYVPIHYIYRSLPFTELLAYYRAADVALITPLKDGMNLVAKEYCAAHLDQQGVLVLSEFAGAAAQLGSYAITVNPYDIAGTAAGIVTAFEMSLLERIARMAALQDNVRQENVFWWAESILRANNWTAHHYDAPIFAKVL